MKTLIVASLCLVSGMAVAEIPYGAWQQGGAWQQDHPIAYDIPDAQYQIPSKEIADIIKGLDFDKHDIVIKDPHLPVKPVTERDARDAYWKALRQHANGKGTIEQVEAAYRELLPYRK